MIQTTRSPVEVFCQRMSAWPSPLKSPEPAMLHDTLGAPTTVAPRNVSTSLIGFAKANVLLPAKSNPTACGFVTTSSTISDPESPLSRNAFPELAITIWQVKVLVYVVPPHSFV